MATYADTTINVISIDDTSAGTHLTVTTGSRAKVVITYLSLGANSTFSINSDIVVTDTGGGGSFLFPNESSTTGIDTYFSREIWLNSGDTITSTGTLTKFTAVVEEYSNP